MNPHIDLSTLIDTATATEESVFIAWFTYRRKRLQTALDELGLSLQYSVSKDDRDLLARRVEGGVGWEGYRPLQMTCVMNDMRAAAVISQRSGPALDRTAVQFGRELIARVGVREGLKDPSDFRSRSGLSELTDDIRDEVTADPNLLAVLSLLFRASEHYIRSLVALDIDDADLGSQIAQEALQFLRGTNYNFAVLAVRRRTAW